MFTFTWVWLGLGAVLLLIAGVLALIVLNASAFVWILVNPGAMLALQLGLVLAPLVIFVTVISVETGLKKSGVIAKLPRKRFKVAVVLTSITCVLSLACAAGINYVSNRLWQYFPANASTETVSQFFNVALLGSDSGSGDSERIDSITVLSFNSKNHQTTAIVIPRGVIGAPIPSFSPLLQVFPRGSLDCGPSCQLGFLYPSGQLLWSALYPDTKQEHSSPGIEALLDGVEGVTSLKLDAYVKISIAEWQNLVDALGGVTVNVQDAIPMAASNSLEEVEGWIQPGIQKLDGHEAAWFVRSRAGTSDNDRHMRQFQIVDSLLKQYSFPDFFWAINNFQQTSSAGFQTNISAQMLPTILDNVREISSQGMPILSLQVDDSGNSLIPFEVFQEQVQDLLSRTN